MPVAGAGAGAGASSFPSRGGRLQYGVDEHGEEILMLVTQEEEEEEEEAVAEGGGQRAPYCGRNKVVMMGWEEAYMKHLVEALGLQADDEVLEIGWGLGYSATAIQRHRPKRHIIIECDAGVLARAETWKQDTLRGRKDSGSTSIELVAGCWQTVLPTLRGRFTAVFMDDFPLPVEDAGAEDEARVLAATGGSRWHPFLDLVVSHHLRPGGRVTGYLAHDLDLGRADCTYSRRPVEVMVAPNCTYAMPGRQTYFIPLVTRKADLGESGGGGGGGCATHIVTGRARGDDAIVTVPPADGGASRKRRRMVDAVLAARKARDDRHEEDEEEEDGVV